MRKRGFTLIELLTVLLLLALLASIVTPVVLNSIHRAKESALKENLFVLRKAIDDYYADKGVYPDELGTLVEAYYLRKIPSDSVTDKNTAWVLERVNEENDYGIRDIHSASEDTATDGSRYSTW